jgi:hypothetical protein
MTDVAFFRTRRSSQDRESSLEFLWRAYVVLDPGAVGYQPLIFLQEPRNGLLTF